MSQWWLCQLGVVPYAEALQLQQWVQAARRADQIPDVLLLLQHPPTVSMGRGASWNHVLRTPEQLAAEGIALVETDRGGDVTYHGPGQWVGYPLAYLPPGQQDVRKYVCRLEEVLIRAVAEAGISATRIDGWHGVWVDPSKASGPSKIAALGVHFSRWYTRHGFALNVDVDLQGFSKIVPCGISEAGVTSLAAEGSAFGMDAACAALQAKFSEVFEAELEPVSPTALLDLIRPSSL